MKDTIICVGGYIGVMALILVLGPMLPEWSIPGDVWIYAFLGLAGGAFGGMEADK